MDLATSYTSVPPCASTHNYHIFRTADMAREAHSRIAGPMPLKNFIEGFFPLSAKEQKITVPTEKIENMQHFLTKMGRTKKEVNMYGHFIKAVEPLCPNFPPIDTHATPFRNFDGMDIKPDVSFYDKRHLEQGCKGISAVDMHAEMKFALTDDAFADSPQVFSYAVEASDPLSPILDPEMLKETTPLDDEENQGEDESDSDGDDTGLACGPELDNSNLDTTPFQSDIEELSNQALHTLGQITLYTAAQRSSQFRKHLFSLLIFKKHGRILFWDCSGVLVTVRFHLADEWFAEFFWRYNKASRGQRGHDETISPLRDTERDAIQRLNIFDSEARLVKVLVEEGSEKTYYVAEQTTFMGGKSPFGRCTRGFEVYSLQEIMESRSKPGKNFLKDTWRIIGRNPEHEFYDKLRGISYIPTYRQAGDVPRQETTLMSICEWAQGVLGRPKGVRRLQHYRLVLEQIGSPLYTFKSSKELVTVVYQALQAHQTAYETGVLHRDISVGNIMIGDDGSALLVDWDMANFTDDDSVGNSERRGTWEFMAARLILPPEKTLAPTLVDDLESFLYVLTWVIFRYTKVAFSPFGLYETMNTIFSHSRVANGERIGGYGKLDYLKGDGVLDRAELENRNVDGLLRSIKNVIAARYARDTPIRPFGLYKEYASQAADALKRRQDTLRQPGWMARIFEKALSTPWPPEDDPAKANPIHKPTYKIGIKRRPPPSETSFGNVDAKKAKIADIPQQHDVSSN